MAPGDSAAPRTTETPGTGPRPHERVPARAAAILRPIPRSTPPCSRRLQTLQGGTGDLTAKLAKIFTRDTARRLDELQDAVKRRTRRPSPGSPTIKAARPISGRGSWCESAPSIEARAEPADLGSTLARTDALQHEFMRVCDALAMKLTTS